MTPSRAALIEAHFHLRVLLRILSHYQILTSIDNVALVLIILAEAGFEPTTFRL